MFRCFAYRLLSLLVLLSLIPCHASAIEVSADSSILIEQRSGRVLYEHRADEERLIASITKIMTAVTAVRYGTLGSCYTVTEEDMAEGSSMYLRVGETLTLEELLYGLLLSSGNDAALAIAHCVSGSVDTFVDRMNDFARELGMTRSSFANPNGLDAEGHYSTAGDMAILTAYALTDPVFCRIVSTRSATVCGRSLTNHNRLLTICDGCIGVKTGYTKAAGRTLVSAVTRDGMTLIAVTLKDSNDWDDHVALYEYGFSSYRLKTLARAGQKLACISLINGQKHSVMLTLAEDLSYPVAEGEALSLKICIPPFVNAPVTVGQVLGTAYICLNGQDVASVDLVVMESVARSEENMNKSFFYRLFH